jgi:hypothetical protein
MHAAAIRGAQDVDRGPLADKTVTASGDSITPMVADSVSCR